MRKFVLTGGVCAGKSETLLALGREGFHMVEEAARVIIKEQLNKGGEVLPWVLHKHDEFQQQVAKLQLELEDKPRGDAFLDRSVIDGIAFYRALAQTPSKEVMDAACNARYDKGFYLEMLPEYHLDEGRRMNIKHARLVHTLIKNVYEELGYELIHVPFMSIKDRVDFIKRHIEAEAKVNP